MCMLHGVTIDHVLAIPTCDFLKSSRANPTAWSIARLAARSEPSTTSFEYSRCRLAPFLAAAFLDGALAGVLIKTRGDEPSRDQPRLAGRGERKGGPARRNPGFPTIPPPRIRGGPPGLRVSPDPL